ncbi:MAG: tail fiber domain-containing protein [Bdellovibrionaceae bacterium]|nr:tail fiber domain-containing protein [Pseudobdellovibrionaceae bacterium]
MGKRAFFRNHFMRGVGAKSAVLMALVAAPAMASGNCLLSKTVCSSYDLDFPVNINTTTGPALTVMGGNAGIGTTAPQTLMQVGDGGEVGKMAINSLDGTFGQLQIGNPFPHGEASMVFLSGVTGFGSEATSSLGLSAVWSLGVGGYGIGGEKFAFNNVAHGPILTMTSAGFVGIGTTSPTSLLQVAGTEAGTIAYISNADAAGTALSAQNEDSGFYGALGTPTYGVYSNGQAGGTTAWANVSDERLKTQIEVIPDALERLLSLRGVSYHWKDKKRDQKEGEKIGLIAQDVEKVFPQAVISVQGTKMVSSTDLMGPMIQGMKQMNEKLQSLERENQELKARLNAIEAALSKSM